MSWSYPVRCQIVDAEGDHLAPGIIEKTPDVSKPHIGKRGLAERTEDGYVKITLDDGNILMGYECWWMPLEAK